MAYDPRQAIEVVWAVYEARGERAAVLRLQKAMGGSMDTVTARAWVRGWVKAGGWVDPPRRPRLARRFVK